MSVHALPANLNATALRARLVARLREPSGVVYGDGLHQPPTAVEFTPDLSAGEQTTLADVLAALSDQGDATSDLRDQYAAAVNALDAIIARNGTFTTAQAGNAIDTLARIQRRTLRLLKAQVG